MGGSYKQCHACGKRALSMASRCPGCGGEFPANETPKDAGGLDLGRFLTPKAVATVLVVVGVLVSTRAAWTDQPGDEKAEVASSLGGTPKVETTGTAPGQTVSTDPVETVSTDPVETASVVALPAEGGSELRVARSLTEVRKARSVRAPLEAVLMQGDTVLADSLEQGWYRVMLEGEVLGYADRSALAALR
jgi:hypothetical protein